MVNDGLIEVKMTNENEYVNYFYSKYHGRMAIGVGYNQRLLEIFPFVFENTKKESIGVVALDVVTDDLNAVHIYHLGAFVTNIGNGSKILHELCLKADKFKIILSVSPVSMPNGRSQNMDSEILTKWYERFGFKGIAGLIRKPKHDSLNQHTNN